MLTVFLIVLPAALNPETDLGWGRAPEGGGVTEGSRVVDGARRPVLGVAGVDLLCDGARELVLFLVLGTGSAGRAIVGGPFEGRDGLGSVVMVKPCSPNVEGQVETQHKANTRLWPGGVRQHGNR